MSRSCKTVKRVSALVAGALAILAAGAAFADPAAKYGIGRTATPEEIAGWNRTIRADDGLGLPPGQGSVAQGEELFAEKCAVCHGDFAEGTRYLALVGGIGSLASREPIRTVGSLWPYAPGVFGYIYTAMPFGQRHSLTTDETYAIVAFILYLNDLIKEDEVLDAKKLVAIRMPNRDGFISPDPRPDMPASAPCMENCRKGAPVKITSRAKDLDVTPDTKPPTQ
jgi:S-disulfanyl-L-cysteine oxidoreductase SoxD